VTVVSGPGSDVGEIGFTVSLFVVATQPAASIHPTAITRTQGTIGFIGGSIIGCMFFCDDSILQSTEALQSGFPDFPEEIQRYVNNTWGRETMNPSLPISGKSKNTSRRILFSPGITVSKA